MLKQGKKFTTKHKEKLSEAKRLLGIEDTKEIKMLYNSGNFTQKELSAAFGVSVINKVIKNKYFRRF